MNNRFLRLFTRILKTYADNSLLKNVCLMTYKDMDIIKENCLQTADDSEATVTTQCAESVCLLWVSNRLGWNDDPPPSDHPSPPPPTFIVTNSRLYCCQERPFNPP